MALPQKFGSFSPHSCLDQTTKATLTMRRGARPRLWSGGKQGREASKVALHKSRGVGHSSTISHRNTIGTETQRLFTGKLDSECFYLQLTEQPTDSSLKTKGYYLKQRASYICCSVASLGTFCLPTLSHQHLGRISVLLLL